MKKISVFLLIFLLLALFMLPVSANELSRVIDEANLLTSSEEDALQERIDSLIDEHDFDFVIVYVDDIGSSTPAAYADDYFDYNGYGFGSDRDGILLLVSMAERDWYISTSGSGISCFSDSTLDSIGDDFVPYLSDGDYYEAACEFLSAAEAVLEGDYYGSSDEYYDDYYDDYYNDYYYSDNYVDSDKPNGFSIRAELVVIAISVVIAFVIAGAVKRSMNTARQQTGASAYTSPKGANITVARDTFLYSTVTKVKIESDSSHRSGGSSHHSSGGSSHHSSSGHSHGGRGGKF